MYGASSLFSNENPRPKGEMLNGGLCTYDYYETKDGRYLSVGALEPQFAKVFFDTIGRQEWLMRAADVTLSNQEELSRDIQKILKMKTLAEWESIFRGKDCCVEPVLTVQEAISHPRTEARGLVVDVKHGEGYALYFFFERHSLYFTHSLFSHKNINIYTHTLKQYHFHSSLLKAERGEREAVGLSYPVLKQCH